MPVISGVLKDGAGQPVVGCTIQLKAVNTTRAVIVTTTASVGTDAGKYRIEALPARYEVTLAVEGFPPQKVGVIDVYADSPDGSLNDYLTVVSGDYLIPDALKHFEQLAQLAREAADQAEAATQDISAIKDAAEKAASNALLSEKSAGGAALAAKGSETRVADSATKADASEKAAALHEQGCATHETNAEQSATDAALSATNAADAALSAEKSATEAAGHAADAQEQAVNAGTCAEAARQAAQSAAQAADKAASDAVTGVARKAVTLLVSSVSEDMERAEKAATSAETSSAGAQKALEEAKLIAKTPGPSAYEVWRDEQNKTGAPDSVAAYMKFQEGKSNLVPFGEVGSYVLGFVWNPPPDDPFFSGGIVGGEGISIVSAQGGPSGLDLDVNFSARPLSGRWQAMSDVFTSGMGGCLYLLQRIK